MTNLDSLWQIMIYATDAHLHKTDSEIWEI